MTRLRGKQGPLWLPSFTADLTIASVVTAGDTHIDVRQCGLVYTGLQTGRQYAISAAAEMLHFTAVSSPGSGIERLTLSAPIAGALAVGDSLSFADVGRLDSDTIDIHHQTDSDGVAQVELPFRSFPNIRDGSGTSVLGIVTGTMDSAPCGEMFVLLNPSFEEGSADHWNASTTAIASGSAAYASAPVTAAIDGTYFIVSSAGSPSTFYQDIAVPSYWWTQIDGGTSVISNVAAYHMSVFGDEGELTLSFLNGSGGVISSISSGLQPNVAWTLVTLPPTGIPALTRTVRIGTNNVRMHVGVNNYNFWDDFSQPGVSL